MRTDFKQPLAVTVFLPSAKMPRELVLLLCRVTRNLEPSEIARAPQPLAAAAPVVVVIGTPRDTASLHAAGVFAFAFEAVVAAVAAAAAAAAAAATGMLIVTPSPKRWPAMDRARVAPTDWCKRLRSLSVRGNARGDAMHHLVPLAL